MRSLEMLGKQQSIVLDVTSINDPRRALSVFLCSLQFLAIAPSDWNGDLRLHPNLVGTAVSRGRIIRAYRLGAIEIKKIAY